MKLYLPFSLSGYFMTMVLPAVFSFSLAYDPRPSSAIQQRVWRTCPTGCMCNMTLVNCTQLRMREIPMGIPLDTTVLDLSFNRLSELNLYRLKALPRLRELNLRENGVVLLPTGIWSKVPQLRLLDLSSNRIACRCPLEWLEKQLRGLHWNVTLVNQHATNCSHYQNSEQTAQPTSLKSCTARQRWKRTPSCDLYPCDNGGTCIPGRQPACKCAPLFYGRMCEFRVEDGRSPTEDGFAITVVEVTPTSIEITWSSTSTSRAEGRYRVEVFLISPSTQWLQEDPVEVSQNSYVVERLSPGKSYKICVTAQTEDKTPTACIFQTTRSAETTIASATEKDATFYVHGHDGNDPLNSLPKGKSNHAPEGDEMHYAFISLAALFGICLLLTMAIGFVYYKRVHSNINEEDNQRNATENAGTARPPVEDIVLVSRGSEINNRGATNPAFESHAADEEAASVDNDHNSKRLVRFNLPNPSQASPNGNDVQDDTEFTSHDHRDATDT